MNEEKLDKEKVGDMCVDLMGYCLNHFCNGFTLDYKTPKGIAHFTFSFTVDKEGE